MNRVALGGLACILIAGGLSACKTAEVAGIAAPMPGKTSPPPEPGPAKNDPAARRILVRIAFIGADEQERALTDALERFDLAGPVVATSSGTYPLPGYALFSDEDMKSGVRLDVVQEDGQVPPRGSLNLRASGRIWILSSPDNGETPVSVAPNDEAVSLSFPIRPLASKLRAIAATSPSRAAMLALRDRLAAPNPEVANGALVGAMLGVLVSAQGSNGAMIGAMAGGIAGHPPNTIRNDQWRKEIASAKRFVFDGTQQTIRPDRSSVSELHQVNFGYGAAPLRWLLVSDPQGASVVGLTKKSEEAKTALEIRHMPEASVKNLTMRMEGYADCPLAGARPELASIDGLPWIRLNCTLQRR